MNLTNVLDEMFNGLISSAERKNTYYSGYDTLIMKLNEEDELTFSLHDSNGINRDTKISYHSLNKEDQKADWTANYDIRLKRKIDKGYFVLKGGSCAMFNEDSITNILKRYENALIVVAEVDVKTGVSTILWDDNKGGLIY